MKGTFENVLLGVQDLKVCIQEGVNKAKQPRRLDWDMLNTWIACVNNSGKKTVGWETAGYSGQCPSAKSEGMSKADWSEIPDLACKMLQYQQSEYYQLTSLKLRIIE